MNAPDPRSIRAAFDKATPVEQVARLRARGWDADIVAGSLLVTLAHVPCAMVALVATGKPGDDALRILTGRHGELPRVPFYGRPGARVRLFRVPESVDRLPHISDFFGRLPGLELVASGTIPIPPAIIDHVETQWRQGGHAADTEPADLPAWVVALACDPAAAERDGAAVTAALGATAQRDAVDVARAMTETAPSAMRPLTVAEGETLQPHDSRPTIVVQGRVVIRDEEGRQRSAVIERATVPDLARQGLTALSASAWGSRVFVLENSNPPSMVHVLTPEGDRSRARVVTTSRNVLRGWLSGAARWVSEGAGKSGRETHESDPPDAVVAYALESCEGMRPLRGVVESPVMRADGSLLSEPGYDAATHLYASFDAAAAREALESIPAHPTQADAAEALMVLHDLVRDFPFEKPEHRATWTAGLATMLAREAVSGPVPLFLCRANTPGSGKTLLTELAHVIATGERPAMLTWTGNEEEFEKHITTEAIAGSRCVIIDNITGTFRSATLDRILTSGKHRARILGGNTKFDGPFEAVLWGSGNNVDVSADLASRRVAPIELVSQVERPEDRTGFTADAGEGAGGETGTAALFAKARRERWRYVAAVLTILRAWHCAGRPGRDLPAWGSFESWSRVVRGALVHAGDADPGKAREEFRDAASSDAGNLRALLAGWIDATLSGLLSPDGEPLGRAVKKLVREGATAPGENPPREPRGEMLREALESLAGGERIERWRGEHSEKLGKVMRSSRRKVADVPGRWLAMFDTNGTTGGSARWRATPAGAAPPTPGEDRGDSGDRGDDRLQCVTEKKCSYSDVRNIPPIPPIPPGGISEGFRGYDEFSEAFPEVPPIEPEPDGWT